MTIRTRLAHYSRFVRTNRFSVWSRCDSLTSLHRARARIKNVCERPDIFFFAQLRAELRKSNQMYFLYINLYTLALDL